MADAPISGASAFVEAPFHSDLAQAPDGACAYWVEAPGGMRVRIGHLATGAKGTVLLFPGRTEYIEKYGPAAKELRARGYGCLSIDWRGQGLSEGRLFNRGTGHVEAIGDYQADVAAILQAAQALSLPEPFFLIGHSMGGGIGLRALMQGLPVAAAVFTGPMWGIQMAPWLRPIAWTLLGLAHPLGLRDRTLLGSADETYVINSPFEGNALTTDPEMYAFMRGQVQAQPDLSLGPPSLHWILEALKECRAMERLPSPDVPALCVVGADESIVDVAAMQRRIARWFRGELWSVDGKQHEVMMEDAATRKLLFDRVCSLFDAHR